MLHIGLIKKSGNSTLKIINIFKLNESREKMQRFRKFTEEKAGDKCSCCNSAIDESGKCSCGADCEHCGGQHDVSDADQQNESYTTGSEKGFKGGHRAHLKNPQGKTSYLGGTSYKKPKHAEGEAKAYHDAYFNSSVKNNERGAERAVANYRKANKQHIHNEAVENDIAAAYMNENNISIEELENMTEEELNEFIGKAVGGAFKIGAKAALGATRLAKKTVNRASASGRADAAEKKADAQEKKNKDRARIKAAQDRLRAAKDAARNK